MNAAVPSLDGLTVVVAGAAGASGVACATLLTEYGATVVALGSHAGRLEAALGHLDRVDRRVCDLTDVLAVNAVATALSTDYPSVDGLIHLVGGWRGGNGITGQTDDDYDALHAHGLTTLRNTSRAFYAPLLASSTGRLAIVSSTAVDRPTAAVASYAAVKSAAETWTRAVAEGFRTDQQAGDDGAPVTAAATTLVVKALLDDALRAKHPERRFPGYTHVDELATAVAGLYAADAQSINGERIVLAG
ncbi:SDR family NAD(P)-dependent oxidoreductase [Arthrobacter sp. AET 35A]|uniref:SDR family NAD(P)-dependent oxidoreductase n=1 Tax=Arthrobacter sp. AET 35A TaxID=2292643 RepID=UPI00177B4EB9|nr:SDR family oxidoreductase [Arthrobacter sp. AET 35A]MBE0011589.1 SDR family NAD(P)-dependent oxidoreductase [Arthrobacter sp. AET 35A]